MAKTDILFTGFYGRQNTGDDAFVEVASWGAKKYWDKGNNRFLAKKSKLPKTLTPTKGYLFDLKRTYSIQALYLLNNTKNFMYAGGSTIHSKMKKKNIRLKAVKKKEANHKFKFGAIGVSIGPFKTEEDKLAVQSYLKQMDFLAVRDQASYDIVSDWKLPFKPVNAFDLAALLPEVYNYDFNKNENSTKVIGISVCQYETLQYGMDVTYEEKRNSMLVNLIKELDNIEDFHFRFYIINGDSTIGDEKLTRETIAKALPKSYEVFNYSSNTKQTWESIASCDFMISTRLHAAIFACFANVPFMLNEYHRKCGDFLDNVGYSDNYRLFNSDYDVVEKSKQVVEIVNKPESYHQPKYIKEMTEKARLNFTAVNVK